MHVTADLGRHTQSLHRHRTVDLAEMALIGLGKTGLLQWLGPLLIIMDCVPGWTVLIITIAKCCFILSIEGMMFWSVLV